MARRPNILIFMTDHQRGDTVLPEHPALTPNLTAFAQEGVTFTEAYCPTPHCCPSRATFHTSLYPSRHGVWNNVCNDQALSRGLNDGVRCWSEDLADAGYRMAFAGKWHVSAEESPKDRGWRELFVTGMQRGEHNTPWNKYRQLAGTPDATERGEGQILRPGYGTATVYGTDDGQWHALDERVMADALAALPELAAGDAPWALFVGVHAPHDPYFPPAAVSRSV